MSAKISDFERLAQEIQILKPEERIRLIGRIVESVISDKTPPNNIKNNNAKEPLFNPEGIWSEHADTILADDITEARKEMWGKFRREDDV